jgi:predicted CXXCH cytochrome family protein
MRRVHHRSFLSFASILTAALAMSGSTAAAEESCSAVACHGPILEGKNAHPPTESCESCHESTASPHPQQGKKTFKLGAEQPDLCTTCHEALGTKGHVHPPVKDGTCTTCHDPHSSDHAGLLLKPEKDTCVGCHAGVLRKGATVLHGPIAEGRCTPCHDPHGSQHAGLLVDRYPAEPYAPYTDQEYALCFGCHGRDLLRYPDTSSATNFRDGERNLHFLHVNDEKKGRSCALCHESHAGRNAVLVADSVPFGTWQLPLKFEKTETGGSCAPGCHRPYAYKR